MPPRPRPRLAPFPAARAAILLAALLVGLGGRPLGATPSPTLSAPPHELAHPASVGAPPAPMLAALPGETVRIDYAVTCARLRPVRWGLLAVLFVGAFWALQPVLRWGRTTGWGGWPTPEGAPPRWPWRAVLRLAALAYVLALTTWFPARLPHASGRVLGRCTYLGPQPTRFPDDIALPALTGQRTIPLAP